MVSTFVPSPLYPHQQQLTITSFVPDTIFHEKLNELDGSSKYSLSKQPQKFICIVLVHIYIALNGN